jgi:hypothetical protein
MTNSANESVLGESCSEKLKIKPRVLGLPRLVFSSPLSGGWGLAELD